MNEKDVNETCPLVCEKNHFVLDPLHERGNKMPMPYVHVN